MKLQRQIVSDKSLSECPSLMSLTPLFKGSNVPTKINSSFTGARQKPAHGRNFEFWLDAIPVTTSD